MKLKINWLYVFIIFILVFTVFSAVGLNVAGSSEQCFESKETGDVLCIEKMSKNNPLSIGIFPNLGFYTADEVFINEKFRVDINLEEQKFKSTTCNEFGIASVYFESKDGIIKDQWFIAGSILWPNGCSDAVGDLLRITFEPKQVGESRIRVLIRDTSGTFGQTVYEEVDYFNVITEDSSCPESFCSNWLKFNSIQYGDQYKKTCTSYTENTCTEDSTTFYKTQCDPGYVIKGKSTNVENKLTSCEAGTTQDSGDETSQQDSNENADTDTTETTDSQDDLQSSQDSDSTPTANSGNNQNTCDDLLDTNCDNTFTFEDTSVKILSVIIAILLVVVVYISLNKRGNKRK